MLVFTPIHNNIQETLFEKMNMLDKSPKYSIGSTRADVKGVDKNYMFARSTWLRMVSLSTEWSSGGNKPVILMGGEADDNGNLVGNTWGKRTSTTVEAKKTEHTGMDGPPAEWTEGWTEIHEPKHTKYDTIYGKYYLSGDMPFRPMPGITNVDVEYKGGGMKLGATRTATITWSCWTWEDLNRLMPHFLHHGKSVFLDWGWSGVGALKDVEPYPLFKTDAENKKEFDKQYFEDMVYKMPEYVLKQKGNYDALLGKVQNFEWSVNDNGGFDCTTTLISQGVSSFQRVIKTDINGQALNLPLLLKQGSGFFDWSNKFIASDDDGLLPSGVEATEKLKEGINKIMDKQDAVFGFTGKALTEEHTEFSTLPIEHWKDLIPYVSFKTYMQDFASQVKRTFGMQGSPEARNSAQIIWPRWLNKVGDNENVIPGLFCTWGWFEDNVLSRFFGIISGVGECKSAQGIIRSIEPIYDNTGTEVGRQSVKIRNSKALLTTDSSKFLLIKDDNLSNKIKHACVNNTIQMVGSEFDDFDFFKPFGQYGKGWNNNPDHYFPVPVSFSPQEVEMEFWLDKLSDGDITDEKREKLLEHKVGICSETEGFIRNIYFNVGYLMDKAIGIATLEDFVTSVWDGVSNEYGGIFNFGMDLEDNGNTIVIRDRGTTDTPVEDMLLKENKSTDKKENGKFTDINKLFEFPVWEKNSMVKSQTLSAKLPKRMQLAAMYGSNQPNSKAEEGTEDWDERAALAWGKMFKPDETHGEKTLEELRNTRYKNLISDNTSFPSARNLSFGSSTAHPMSNDGNLVLGVEADSEEHTSGGTIVYPSILNNIFLEQKEALQSRLMISNAKLEIDGDGNVVAKDLITTEDDMIDYQAKWNLYQLGGGKTAGAWDPAGIWDIYDWDIYWKSHKKFWGHGTAPFMFSNADAHPVIMKPEVKHILQYKLKRGRNNIVSGTDPLIPVELELELDGIGGVFPGNAFQSSYLPKRYQEMACFQVMGVSHKIDSTGWYTTIKGQIRVSIPLEVNDEDRLKLKREAIETHDDLTDAQMDLIEESTAMPSTIYEYSVSYPKPESMTSEEWRESVESIAVTPIVQYDEQTEAAVVTTPQTTTAIDQTRVPMGVLPYDLMTDEEIKIHKEYKDGLLLKATVITEGTENMVGWSHWNETSLVSYASLLDSANIDQIFLEESPGTKFLDWFYENRDEHETFYFSSESTEIGVAMEKFLAEQTTIDGGGNIVPLYNNPKYMDTDPVSGAPPEYNSEIHGLDNFGNIVKRGSNNDVSGYYGQDGIWISVFPSGG